MSQGNRLLSENQQPYTASLNPFLTFLHTNLKGEELGGCQLDRGQGAELLPQESAFSFCLAEGHWAKSTKVSSHIKA
jgi:hypothetical protein